MAGGRPLRITWKHPAEVFYRLYKAERDIHIAKRWQALWLLRRGEPLIRVKEIVGVTNKPIQQWIRWYEKGGIEEVARHRRGGSGVYRQAWTPEQKEKILERATREGFRTIREAVRWGEEALGVKVSEAKMGYWFRKWGIVRKVPRPMAEKADEKAQEEWKKGFMEALSQEGVKRGEVVVFADEMRLGLLGQIRRRWVRRGVKPRQQVELRYEWRYLLLGVEAWTGRLWWA